MKYPLIGVLGFMLVAFPCLADTSATTADGRQVILHDNGTWRLATESGREGVAGRASLTLEKRQSLVRGCRLGLRLQNDLAAQIRTLVLRFTAYKGERIPFETVSRGFSYIKPTVSQYQEISFRGIDCDEISSVEVAAAGNCHVGELTKYSANEEDCLQLVEVRSSEQLPIARRALVN